MLSRGGDKGTEDYKKRTKKKGIEPLGTICEDPAISLSWLKGKPLERVNGVGPTSALKIMHCIIPPLFMMWDEKTGDC